MRKIRDTSYRRGPHRTLRKKPTASKALTAREEPQGHQEQGQDQVERLLQLESVPLGGVSSVDDVGMNRNDKSEQEGRNTGGVKLHRQELCGHTEARSRSTQELPNRSRTEKGSERSRSKNRMATQRALTTKLSTVPRCNASEFMIHCHFGSSSWYIWRYTTGLGFCSVAVWFHTCCKHVSAVFFFCQRRENVFCGHDGEGAL